LERTSVDMMDTGLAVRKYCDAKARRSVLQSLFQY
jgi:hypothetical protein